MGIYSHYTTDELKALREKLIAALHSPSSTAYNGRSLAQRSASDIRRELNDINAELGAREGAAPNHRPIYVI